ncbi:uncharacterized protein Z518_08533 [Rhinocladiella mackenziei CBS 650.93]|uniref:Rhinocladiella mackenziei CBS 650.93 unplaced genomic scaffold supercont1.6, whole genome shotgun sequence n=1 Tax=Rhinocladiella mackenziei CBS 650.93 TaxID=1442369 RepID=A0A0D2FKX9_9EURO|nr:uncharacterized protein Z518_08533 [Rhinocladiella mackenziei CBS 650.93]KIX02592.1 hypothetical protein Z518_08533 [Rhinocladiella mackenziei CBS 650.93]
MSGPPVPFSSLPLSKEPSSARLNAWGAYGPSDELGFLNRQTPSTVSAAAASEIRTGIRVPLDAALDFQGPKPLFGRQIFQKDVYQKKPRIVHDDTWSFNTQSSTQWDGLRHFGYQKAGRFYNDTTLEDIAGTSDRGQKNPNVLGIQNAVTRGGVMGRGILVDFRRWIDEGPGMGIVGDGFKSFETSGIKFEWLLETLKWQGTVPKFGDILIVRSGFFKSYYEMSANNEAELDRLTNMSPPGLGGVEQSDQVLKWIWDHFSAVASDHPSFERWPTTYEWSMHEVLLAGWGCHIGELLDLEALSKECARQKRWSFFVASVPCYVPGGVASPVNGVAIF